jgi:hypothetical protein
MRSLVLLAALILGLGAAQPFAQQSVLPNTVRAAADSITAEQLKRDLDFLASDDLKGRNTPSPGFDTAAEYIAARLKKAGLKPLGDNGTYFQRYTMRESRVDTDGAYIEIAGRKLSFGNDFVMRSFAGPISGTLPLVYVGHGWVVPGRGIDPYAGVDVRGKLVVAHGPRALPKGVEIRQIGRIAVGASSPQDEAARLGAAGILFIPQSTALKNWEQMREQSLTRRELDPSVPSAYAAPRITSVLLSSAAAEALMAGERGAGADIVSRGDAADYPASFELMRKVTVNIPVASAVEHRPYNVVAMIEGSDTALKTEYLTVESHLDGAVGTRTIDGDAIYNSADDNASGSAGNLAIAERMAALSPKRSIIFIWDSGEEQGLWGTRYFVANPPVPLQNIVAHFNIDMIGANRAAGSSDASSTTVTGPNEVYLVGPGVLAAGADALLERINAAYLNMKFNRDFDKPEHEFFYPRTDAGPFLERGILTIGFFTGIHPRYHQPSDEARHLDPKKMEAITRTAFASIWAFADAAERPRIDKSIPSTVPRYGAR